MKEMSQNKLISMWKNQLGFSYGKGVYPLTKFKHHFDNEFFTQSFVN